MRKKKEIVVRLDDDDEESERPVPATAFKRGQSNPHQFQPGISGNPSGRPRNSERRLISKALRVRLAARAPNKISEALGIAHGSSWAQCLAASLMVRAVKGDTLAARLILEYAEPQTLNIGIGGIVDEDGNPVPVPDLQIVFNDDLAPNAPADFQPPPPVITPALPLPPLPCKID